MGVCSACSSSGKDDAGAVAGLVDAAGIEAHPGHPEYGSAKFIAQSSCPSFTHSGVYK